MDFIKNITSIDNPEVKHVIKLHSKSNRKKYKKFIAQGIRTISAFLNKQKKTSIELLKLYVLKEHENKAIKLIENNKSISFENLRFINNKVLKKMGSTENPSGFIGIFSLPVKSDWDKLSSGIVLSKLQDPGNIGTLIRTAAACNLKTIIILSSSTDPWSPKVVQSSAGALSLVNIYQCSWQELLNNKKLFKLYSLIIPSNKSLSINKALKDNTIDIEKALIVVGNEANGLSIEEQKESDYLLSLPMPGSTESLNAAIAGSLALYIIFVYSQININY